MLPPSVAPVQTVWLIGDCPDRGAGSSRMLRAASSSERTGTATGSLPAAALPLAVPLVAAAPPASRRTRFLRATERFSGGGADPASGPRDRRHELAQLQVEGQHQPEQGDRPQQHDGTRSGQQRFQVRRQEPADPAAAPLGEEVEREDLEGAEPSDVGDREAAEGHPPAGARLLAGTGGDPPATREQQERQEPPAGLEPGGDRVTPPVGQGALAGEEQRDERDGAEGHHHGAEDRANDVRAHAPAEAARTCAAAGRAARWPASSRIGSWWSAVVSPSLRPRPRRGRPSVVASSARTGSAIRRP